jgi:hypothetical protein
MAWGLVPSLVEGWSRSPSRSGRPRAAEAERFDEQVQVPTGGITGRIRGRPRPERGQPARCRWHGTPQWVFRLEAWRRQQGLEGGEVNASTPVVEEAQAGVGATVMGRNMFGGGPGPWREDPPWNGWWGDNPPFHTPVFVLAHHPRQPLEEVALAGSSAMATLVDDLVPDQLWAPVEPCCRLHPDRPTAVGVGPYPTATALPTAARHPATRPRPPSTWRSSAFSGHAHASRAGIGTRG